MKFYLLSPSGVPMNQHLFPMFIPTWKEQGVEMVYRIEDCDVVCFDLHTRIADYEQSDIDWADRHRPLIVTFDEWDRGGMSKDKWPRPLTIQQRTIFNRCIKDISELKNAKGMVHFCRLLDKNDTYIEEIHRLYPYEKPILYEEPLLTADELFNRPFDVTYIANTAPNREEIKRVFEADGRLKCNFILGAEKLPFDKWVDENRKSKFTISASGGGYGDEKKQNLFSICAIIQEETDQLLLHPFTHNENCLMISQPPTKEDIDVIVDYCNDKEKLYRLYLRNYNFMKTYYSADYIAKDILGEIINHCS